MVSLREQSFLHSNYKYLQIDEPFALPSTANSPDIRIQSIKEIPSHKRSLEPENDLAVASPNMGGNEKRQKREHINPRASTSAHLAETASPVFSSLNTSPGLDTVATIGLQSGEAQPSPPTDNLLYQVNPLAACLLFSYCFLSGQRSASEGQDQGGSIYSSQFGHIIISEGLRSSRNLISRIVTCSSSIDLTRIRR